MIELVIFFAILSLAVTYKFFVGEIVMRTTFIEQLVAYAHQDASVYLLTADLGYSVIEPFKQTFPDRFINVGIAEQNMIGIAAGLAMRGKKVIAYSIIPFVTMRCFEQIRNNICYQNMTVKLVGVGGGVSYGSLGHTHHAIDDIAIMNVLAHMNIVAPASRYEAQALIPDFFSQPGPGYLRLANTDEVFSYSKLCRPQIGKAFEIIPHDEHLIVATSNALDLAYKVQTELAALGMNMGLVSAHTLKPFDGDFFEQKKATLKTVVTIEEHSVIGGLGSIVASVLQVQGMQHVALKIFGIRDVYAHTAGNRKDLLELVGLTPCAIINAIQRNNNKGVV